MPKWSVTAVVAAADLELPDSDLGSAATAVQSQLATDLGGEWVISSVALDPAYAVGDWVLVNRQGGDEYGRVVLDGGSLKVALGNGDLRPLRAILKRM